MSADFFADTPLFADAPPAADAAGGEAAAEAGAEAEARSFAGQMFDVLELLGDVLRQENAALARHDAKAVGALQERKGRLARVYELLWQEVAGNRALLAACDPDERQRLREAQAAFAEVAAENHTLLRANMEAAKRLMAAITEAVKNNRPEPNVYNRAAMLRPAGTGTGSGALSMNQVF